jgi:hypothetical protein
MERANQEIAEAALTVGRDHHEDCECWPCEFAFLVYVEAVNGNVPRWRA